MLKPIIRARGETFEFSTYVTIHQRAHQDLARYEEPVQELKNVRDFLEGITDPRCESIKLQVLSNPSYTNNFMETVNFVAGAIDLLNKNHNALTRCISEVNTGRGGGCTSYNNNRGGRQGRGGGGRGRNLARSYSPEEWQNLSAEERARIYRARENQNQNQGGQGQGSRGRGGGHVLSNYCRGGGRGRGSDDSTRQTSVVHTDGGGGGDGNDTHQVSDDFSEMTRNTSAATNHIEFNNGMTRRRINAIYSYPRRIQSQQRTASQQRSISATNQAASEQCRAELDSHADTCGVGETAYILEYTNRTMDVGAFSQHYQTMEDIPIVKAAVAYDDPITGEIFILVIGQAFYFGDKIQDILLKPNQLRANGVIVEDIPHF